MLEINPLKLRTYSGCIHQVVYLLLNDDGNIRSISIQTASVSILMSVQLLSLLFLYP